MFQYTIDNMMVPGQIESYSLIYDLEGVNPWDVPMELLKLLSLDAAEFFATRGQHAFIVNMPMLVKPLWKVGYYWLPSFTRRGIVNVNANQIKQSKLL
jgi:hypothetical protein